VTTLRVVVTTNHTPVFSPLGLGRDVGTVISTSTSSMDTHPRGAIEIPRGLATRRRRRFNSNRRTARWQLRSAAALSSTPDQQGCSRPPPSRTTSALAPLQETGLHRRSDLLLGPVRDHRAQVPLRANSPQGSRWTRRRIARSNSGLGHRCLHLRAEFWHGRRGAIHSRSGICRQDCGPIEWRGVWASGIDWQGGRPTDGTLTLKRSVFYNTTLPPSVPRCMPRVYGPARLPATNIAFNSEERVAQILGRLTVTHTSCRTPDSWDRVSWYGYAHLHDVWATARELRPGVRRSDRE